MSRRGEPRSSRVLLLAALALLTAACQAVRGPAPETRAPYVVVLGTAQDGGLPQVACAQLCCTAARADPSRRRLVTSLLLVDPRSGRRWLFDATPDLGQQVERARPHLHPQAAGRPALFDGVFLTHAHMGHYGGLLQLGREAWAGQPLPTWSSVTMGEYLRTNGPWSLLFEDGHLELKTLVPGQAVELAQDLRVTPFLVPHRPEFSDTLAFLVEGPERALLYLPDVDAWGPMQPPLEHWLERVDVALLDGTFFDGAELPGRDLSQVPHPFVTTSLERLGPLPETVRARVRFTHLNHSNPAADPSSAAAARVRAAGMHIAREGEIHSL